jgi:hypothetical protein
MGALKNLLVEGKTHHHLCCFLLCHCVCVLSLLGKVSLSGNWQSIWISTHAGQVLAFPIAQVIPFLGSCCMCHWILFVAKRCSLAFPRLAKDV